MGNRFDHTGHSVNDTFRNPTMAAVVMTLWIRSRSAAIPAINACSRFESPLHKQRKRRGCTERDRHGRIVQRAQALQHAKRMMPGEC